MTDEILSAHYETQSQRAFASLDEQLKGRIFLVADAASIADIACYGDLAFAKLCEIDLGAHPAVQGWCARMEALPRFRGPLELLTMEDSNVG